MAELSDQFQHMANLALVVFIAVGLGTAVRRSSILIGALTIATAAAVPLAPIVAGAIVGTPMGALLVFVALIVGAFVWVLS